MNIFHRKLLLAACIAAMMGLHGYVHRKPYTSYHCYGSMRAHSGRWLCGA